jgi:hypothetical protein
MNRLYIGIDNGLHGGIVFLENGKITNMYDMPIIKTKDKTLYNISEIIRIIKLYKYNDNMVVILEQAHARPISGRTQCFNTGYGFGLMQGIISTLNIPLLIVSPQRWQKYLLVGINTGDTKTNTYVFCQRTFPDIDFLRGRKKFHDGLCDAAALSFYGYKTNDITNNIFTKMKPINFSIYSK